MFSKQYFTVISNKEKSRSILILIKLVENLYLLEIILTRYNGTLFVQLRKQEKIRTLLN